MNEQHIAELKRNFGRHPSAIFTDIRCDLLEQGIAKVSTIMPHDWLVNCDMPPGQIVQDGFTGGVLADFAGMLAAMTMVKGHATLIDLHSKFIKPIMEKEIIIAQAWVVEFENRIITVECNIYALETSELKLRSTMQFKVAK